MARTAGVVTDTLLARVRQAGAPGTTNDLAMSILSKCQRTANAGLKRAVTSGTLTTVANTLIYEYRTDFTDSIDILSIKEGDREVQKCNSLADLQAYDADWVTATGTRFEFWLQIGRDILILYPAKTSGSTATVIYTKLTTGFNTYASDYNTTFNLPDEDVDMALELAEILLLLRGKQASLAQLKAKRLIEEVKTHMSTQK